MGAEKQHLKLSVGQQGATVETVWWEARDKALPTGSFDLAFSPQRNEFNGRTTLQLAIAGLASGG